MCNRLVYSVGKKDVPSFSMLHVFLQCVWQLKGILAPFVACMLSHWHHILKTGYGNLTAATCVPLKKKKKKGALPLNPPPICLTSEKEWKCSLCAIYTLRGHRLLTSVFGLCGTKGPWVIDLGVYIYGLCAIYTPRAIGPKLCKDLRTPWYNLYTYKLSCVL